MVYPQDVGSLRCVKKRERTSAKIDMAKEKPEEKSKQLESSDSEI
jgi:hypothetical protein